jgi:hypothetical protein
MTITMPATIDLVRMFRLTWTGYVSSWIDMKAFPVFMLRDMDAAYSDAMESSDISL